MSYRIEVAKDEDLYELMTILWRCFEDPYQAILRVFFPILNNDREASSGQRDEYKESHPELIWLKVVDDKTNKIIAGAKWYFYERDPFLPNPGDSDGHDAASEEAVWYPEGSAGSLLRWRCMLLRSRGSQWVGTAIQPEAAKWSAAYCHGTTSSTVSCRKA
ncbi:hypothetical protein V1517DRAFT_329833 [Lipomyces orientalis]|uniref:Uncharacterized protein n=1 Tax=Lipomyces orientalis TaxID=1233043 RepID=A0ACC3TJJ4_9ASCO